MATHKLANGPATMVVQSIEKTEGNFGPQYRFSGEDGTDVYISELAADRGLQRLNLTPETAVGRTLTLVQVKKDGKTYTNIELAGSPAAKAASAPAPAGAAPAPRPATHALSVAEAKALYSECLDAACATLVQKCEELGIPMDANAVQAATATLFIATKGR